MTKSLLSDITKKDLLKLALEDYKERFFGEFHRDVMDYLKTLPETNFQRRSLLFKVQFRMALIECIEKEIAQPDVAS